MVYVNIYPNIKNQKALKSFIIYMFIHNVYKFDITDIASQKFQVQIWKVKNMSLME